MSELWDDETIKLSLALAGDGPNDNLVLNIRATFAQMQARIVELERLLAKTEKYIKELESVMLDWQGTL